MSVSAVGRRWRYKYQGEPRLLLPTTETEEHAQAVYYAVGIGTGNDSQNEAQVAKEAPCCSVNSVNHGILTPVLFSTYTENLLQFQLDRLQLSSGLTMFSLSTATQHGGPVQR